MVGASHHWLWAKTHSKPHVSKFHFVPSIEIPWCCPFQEIGFQRILLFGNGKPMYIIKHLVRCKNVKISFKDEFDITFIHHCQDQKRNPATADFMTLSKPPVSFVRYKLGKMWLKGSDTFLKWCFQSQKSTSEWQVQNYFGKKFPSARASCNFRSD